MRTDKKTMEVKEKQLINKIINPMTFYLKKEGKCHGC